MKAVVCGEYGPAEGLVIGAIDEPAVKDTDVLIKVHATSAHIADTKIRKGDPFLLRLIYGLAKPRKNLVLGIEIAGVVSSVGKDVSKFKAGDEVFAFTGFGLGGYAEYICLSGTVKDGSHTLKCIIAHKPVNLSFEEAACVPSGCLTALKNLHKAQLRKGQTMLVYGASGSLGTYAIQLAVLYGAEVTAVCSAKNFELAKALGASEVIDYTVTDVYSLGKKYDVVYDAVMKLNARRAKSIVEKGGIFVNNTNLPPVLEKDLYGIKELIELNKLKPVIDRTYSLDEIQEAHRYVEKGHKVGNVALRVC